MSAQPEFNFAGPSLTPSDKQRLGRQLLRVRDLMQDGRWRTLAEIEAATGAPQASASARLRDLRRLRLNVERRRISEGLWEYRVSEVEA